jgi:hypothetical protein
MKPRPQSLNRNVRSLRDLPRSSKLTGTAVPCYRLSRPCGTAASAEGYVCRKSEHAQGLLALVLYVIFHEMVWSPYENWALLYQGTTLVGP